MKSFLKKIFLFFITAICLYIASINILEIVLPDIFKPNILYQEGNGLLRKKMEESEFIDKPDIIFLGSSHAYQSFDPHLFEKAGISSYNWGTSQQTHPQTQMIIDQYVAKMKPKLVVYEVFPEIFAMSGRESMADFLNAGKPFNVTFFEISQFDNSIALVNTYLIKYTRKFLGIQNKVNLWDETIPYYKGFIKDTAVNSKLINVSKLKWVPKNSQLKSFEENLKLFEKLDIPVLLVVAPYPFEYSNNNEIKNYLESKGELLFYKELLSFDNNLDFSDFHHLNYNGVLKMNKHLIDFIHTEQYLTSSR